MTSNTHRLPYGNSPPGHWSVVPLKYLATLDNGYVFKSEDWQYSGTPIIRIENLNGSSRYNYSALTLDDKYRVRSGDLLFAWSGNPGTSFGPFRWTESGHYFLNQHIFKVSVQSCEKDWLYWSLRAATYWIERELTSGMIGMVHVTKDEVGAVPIPVPSRDQQRRIIDFLNAETARLDRLSELQRKVIAGLDERDSVLLDVVIDELLAKHGTLPFRRFIEGVDQGSSPQCEATPADDDEWGVLKVSSLRPGDFFPEQNKRLPENLTPNRSHEVREGDLLITRANTPQLVGSTAAVPATRRKLLLSDKIFRVRLSPALDARYAALIARGSRVRSLCGATSNGASQSMANIRFEEVKSWPIPPADLDEQRRVVARVESENLGTRSLREKIERQLALLSERRQALITAAVTGQIDVSTASGRGIED
ncbi:restriction endonuclease subunit S [Actinoplanes utahensis]|uniref:restriction endonuclease subunit S n=1 Tax=Actinoplanes utahensis TaxID=1869 RepID=UPI000A010480|nr:restriction endonuclease subunit S [Actinoplanes utahensis]GIF35406.1 hypothetical protein Aut01nite_83920 [Actinoplanes utahensis]